MTDISISIPQCDSIDVVTIADLHLGDPLVDMAEVRRRIDYVASHPDAYAIINGDLMDNATRNSIGDIYHAIHHPQQALDLAVELLRPIASRILAITPGNHERRTQRLDGIDLSRILAQRLGLEDRYAPETALIHLSLGKQNYVIYATHGAGGGRTAGGKINRLDKLPSVVDADIYIMSHVHQPAAYRTGYYRIKGNRQVYTEKLLVLTAATLNYGGYADIQGMQPAAKTNPVVTLMGTKKFAFAAI